MILLCRFILQLYFYDNNLLIGETALLFGGFSVCGSFLTLLVLSLRKTHSYGYDYKSIFFLCIYCTSKYEHLPQRSSAVCAQSSLRR